MRVGFIGLGIMGRPMARNLLKAGYELVVANRSQAAVDDLVAEGAQAATGGKDVAEQVDVVLTMLPNSPEVKEVVLGPGGVLEGAHEGLDYIDMSSIAPLASREVAQALGAKGVQMLDAPVSGGEPGAVAGTLAFMVGGDEDVFERYHGLLSTMGSSVTRVGPVGAGSTTKLVNQAIVAVNIAVLGEALVLARKAEVDPAAVVDAVKGGLAGSAVMNQKAQKMLTAALEPGFRVDLHIKDLGNVLETGHQVGAPLPLTAAVREMMTAISLDGHSRDDHSALVTFYEKLANTVLAGQSAQEATDEQAEEV